MSDGSLIVNVAELQRELGAQKAFRATVALDELAVSRTTVTAGTPVEVDLVLEAIAGPAVSVKGRVVTEYVGECRRCLSDVRGAVEADVDEVYEREPADDEVYPIDDDQIDLGPLVRDAVLLGLPLSPLCSQSCPGPDPETFPVSTEGGAGPVAPEGSEGDVRDPRWAALDVLRPDE